jgi:hypothetical protein
LPNGPAHGFWQFEKHGGVKGVLEHRTTAPIVLPICTQLCYRDLAVITTCYEAIVHNDVLACVFARLLLWTLPDMLPNEDEASEAWSQYLKAWRPGKPHRKTWNDCYATAWRIVTASS